MMTQYQGCVAGRFLEQFDAGNFAIDAEAAKMMGIFSPTGITSILPF